ncbi:MAG TPA: methyltransferase [Gemmatimonadales bacterium]
MTIEQLLGRPWVDRAIAVVAALPFVSVLYYNLQSTQLTIPRVALLLQLCLLVVTMLIRRAPVRVSTRPLYWLVAFVASYYGFLTVSISVTGRPLAPTVLTDGLSMLSVLGDGYARVTLGRNIGFVPAQRRLVTSGPYRVVRHPIYSALFLAEICVVLENFSWVNLLLSLVFLALFVIKTLMEERFLAEDPAYAAYMGEVKYRWIPGVV